MRRKETNIQMSKQAHSEILNSNLKVGLKSMKVYLYSTFQQLYVTHKKY